MLNKYLDQFEDYLLTIKRSSKHTLIAYRNDILQAFSFFEKEFDTTSIENVNHAMARSFVMQLSIEDYKPRAINRKISALKSFYRFLKKEGFLNNPFSKIQSLKLPKRLPAFIRENEVESLLSENLVKLDSYQEHLEYTVLDLFYSTGIRKSELINLKRSDIDIKNSTIKVLGKGNKERIIPLGLSIKKRLNEYIVERDKIATPEVGYFFILENGKKLYPKKVYNIVRKYLSLFSTSSKKSPHVLRHSFATHLSNNGAEINAIKELLGHASLAATQIYTHNTIDKLKKVYRQSHPKSGS